MSRFDWLLPSDTKKYEYSSWEAQICKNVITPLLVCVNFYDKTPKCMQLSGTFSHLGGTELKWNGTSYFCNIWTSNRTSYNLLPLERNLTSYIWNGTFVTTGVLTLIVSVNVFGGHIKEHGYHVKDLSTRTPILSLPELFDINGWCQKWVFIICGHLLVKLTVKRSDNALLIIWLVPTDC